jgi:hypothetical protein
LRKTSILVSTWRDGVFALADGVVRQECLGQAVWGLAPDGDGNALAVVDGKSLCRRMADGAWQTLAKSNLQLACCLAVRGTLYVGTDEVPCLMRVCDDGSFEHLPGFDQVPGRDQWYAGSALINGQLMGPPLGIRSMSATCDGNALLANVHVGGIPRSIDGGASWRPTIDIDSDVHQVCAHPTRPEVVIAATGTGLGVSLDGGETWTLEREGLHASYCSAVGFIGEDLLVAASSDHFAAQGALYRRPIDGHGPLLQVAGGLPQWLDGIADTGNLSVCGSRLALVDRAGKLYVSQDAAHTWARQGDILPTPSSVLVF